MSDTDDLGGHWEEDAATGDRRFVRDDEEAGTWEDDPATGDKRYVPPKVKKASKTTKETK